MSEGINYVTVFGFRQSLYFYLKEMRQKNPPESLRVYWVCKHGGGRKAGGFPGKAPKQAWEVGPVLDSSNACRGGEFFSCAKPFLAGGSKMATRPVPLWQGPTALESGLQDGFMSSARTVMSQTQCFAN